MSCSVLSCIALSCPVLSCLVLSCLVLSCPVLSCLILPCPVLSCLVLSCPVLSCLALPCLAFSLLDVKWVKPDDQSTPLHMACAQGHLVCVEFLFQVQTTNDVCVVHSAHSRVQHTRILVHIEAISVSCSLLLFSSSFLLLLLLFVLFFSKAQI